MISICLPTRGRPEFFKRMCMSALETAFEPNDIEFVSYHDHDDTAVYEYVGNHKQVIGPRIIQSHMFNMCQKVAKGPIYMFMVDDMVFETKGWDAKVKEVFEASDDKILFAYPSDGIPRHAGFGVVGFVHKNWIDTVGYLLPPYFVAWYADNWINALAGRIDRRVYLDQVNLKHTSLFDGEVSKDYTEVINNSKKIYYSKERHDERERDAMLLQAFIDKNKTVQASDNSVSQEAPHVLADTESALYNHQNMTNSELEQIAKTVRKELFTFKTRTGAGHPASCLSLVDIVVSLYHDDATAFDHKKDVLIFSKGHGSPVLYPVLSNLGYYSKAELDKYSSPEGILRVHSDGSIPGCHFVGGSLGNGIGYAAGIALAKPDANIYVILGDGELYEGSVWESLMFIAHNSLSNITLIIDRNGLTTLGSTEELLALEPLEDKFKAFGFDTHSIDGHDFEALRGAFGSHSKRHRAIVANTIKGKGISFMEGKWIYHVIVPKGEEAERGLQELS